MLTVDEDVDLEALAARALCWPPPLHVPNPALRELFAALELSEKRGGVVAGAASYVSATRATVYGIATSENSSADAGPAARPGHVPLTDDHRGATGHAEC